MNHIRLKGECRNGRVRPLPQRVQPIARLVAKNNNLLCPTKVRK